MRKNIFLSILSAILLGGAASALCPVFLYGFAHYERVNKSIWFVGIFVAVSILSFFIVRHYLVVYLTNRKPLPEEQLVATIFMAFLMVILGEAIYKGNNADQYTYPTEINIQISSDSGDFNLDTNPIKLFLAFGDSFAKDTEMEEAITGDGRSVLHYQNVIWAKEDTSAVIKTREAAFDVQILINDQAILMESDDLKAGSFETNLMREKFPPYTNFWQAISLMIEFRIVFFIIMGFSLSFFIVGIYRWDRLSQAEDLHHEGDVMSASSNLGEEVRSKPKTLFSFTQGNIKISTILFISFGLSFLLFYLWPIFLNSQGVYTFIQPVAKANTQIGVDGREIRIIAKEWFLNGKSMYELIISEPSSYTPIAHLFHLPTSFLPDSTAYAIRVFFLLISYLFVGYYVPLRVRNTNSRLTTSIAVLLLAGFFSYGLQFELERGNSNLIAYAFVIIAILLFHFGWLGKKNWLTKIISIILFALAAQLKIYPLIFGIFLMVDWKKWGENIVRFFIYGLVFLAGFFVLGYTVFSEFLYMFTHMIDFPYSWIGNHSLHSYLYFMKDIQEPSETVIYWLYLLLFMTCMLLVIYSAYRRKSILDPGLWLICTIIACVLPSTSHDIKLPLIYTACIYYFVIMERIYNNKKLDWLNILIFGTIGFSVFSLMYSPENRAHIGNLASAFPFFVWMSIALAVQAVRPLITAKGIFSHHIPMRGNMEDSEK